MGSVLLWVFKNLVAVMIFNLYSKFGTGFHQG
jgi:hypothetical protein